VGKGTVACGDLGAFEWVHDLRLGACEMVWVKVVW
jgi:hypothetical protein